MALGKGMEDIDKRVAAGLLAGPAAAILRRSCDHWVGVDDEASGLPLFEVSASFEFAALTEATGL